MTGFLVDHHGRSVEYLRVSITDLCNLRCVYCRPPEGVELIPHDEILRYEEILTVIDVAREMGVRKVRITGGEPLVRRGAVGFVERLTSMKGIDDVGLTTNGTRLAAMAEDLKAAGLKRINVSLDSLRKETFASITGRDELDRVLRGIEKALDLGFSPVKINVVLLAGINEEDIPAFARLTLDAPVDVRFIERMPFGAEQLPRAPVPFSADKAFDVICDEVGDLRQLERRSLDGPATMFRLEGAAGRIGIIDPVTGHFCATCNRLRLTARGTLRPCLLGPTEIDIKSPLRKGASRDELAQVIRAAVLAKPMGNCSRGSRVRDGMNLIGG
jgi:cyclic pyranopterin phosphate synthase